MPGKSHGQWNLLGYSPWGYKESDITEHAHTHTHVESIKIVQMKYILQKNSTYEVNIYSSTYFLQSRNMDPDVENKCLDTKEGKG